MLYYYVLVVVELAAVEVPVVVHQEVTVHEVVEIIALLVFQKEY